MYYGHIIYYRMFQALATLPILAGARRKTGRLIDEPSFNRINRLYLLADHS